MTYALVSNRDRSKDHVYQIIALHSSQAFRHSQAISYTLVVLMVALLIYLSITNMIVLTEWASIGYKLRA